MVLQSYLISQAVFATLSICLWGLAIVQIYCFYKTMDEKRPSKFLKIIAWLQLVGLTLMVIRSVDPDGAHGIMNQGGAHQFISVNVTTIVVAGLIAYIYFMLDSVYLLLRKKMSRFVRPGFFTVVVLEFLSANIPTACGVVINRYWPTALFLLINGPLMFVQFFILTYVAVNLRRMMKDVAGVAVQEQHQNTMTAARSRLERVYCTGSIILIGCGAANFVDAVERFEDSGLTMEAALSPVPDGKYHFEVFGWLHIAILAGSIWYGYVPVGKKKVVNFEERSQTSARSAERKTVKNKSKNKKAVVTLGAVSMPPASSNNNESNAEQTAGKNNTENKIDKTEGRNNNNESNGEQNAGTNTESKIEKKIEENNYNNESNAENNAGNNASINERSVVIDVEPAGENNPKMSMESNAEKQSESEDVSNVENVV